MSRNLMVTKLGATLLVVLATAGLAACSEGTSGTVIQTVTPSAAAEHPTSTTPSLAASSPSQAVRTVYAPRHRRHPKRRTVTRTRVIEQHPTYVAPQPSSFSAIYADYTHASPADSYAYEFSDGADFVSPSGNIACAVTSGGVSCSIQSYEFDQPGPDCSAGIGVELTDYAYLAGCSAYFNVHTGAPVLPYGESLTYDDYVCISESSSVACLNTADDTAFSLSRAAFDQAG